MTIRFHRARVFDGRTFLPGPHDLVVDGERIVSLAPTAADEPVGTSDEQVVDCAGSTVLPGFVDAHVHLMIEEPSLAESAFKPYSLPYYESIGFARATLRAGITSVRDAGGADAGFRRALDLGLVDGPRMKIAIGLMSIVGGHGDNHTLAGIDLHSLIPSPGRPETVVSGADEALRTVRELLRAGADHIKICATGGVLSPNDDPRHAHFSPVELQTIVDEATRQGTYVMAHALGAEGVNNALRAGVRSIEHAIYIDDESIELFLEKDAYLVPTLATLDAVFEYAKVKPLPPAMMAKAEDAAHHQRLNFARAVEAGVKVAMGSDAGVGRHGTNLRELAPMADGGLGLEGALRAGTSTAAELLGGLPVGSLDPGSYADLVVLDFELTTAEQLRGIEERIGAVWKGGRPVPRDDAA